MKNPFDYIGNRRIRVKNWILSGTLFSLGASVLTYIAINMINPLYDAPIFTEMTQAQGWLMASFGMDNWLLLRIFLFVISILIVKYFPMKLYERNQLFRYSINIFVITLVFGFALDFVNDFAVLLRFFIFG